MIANDPNLITNIASNVKVFIRGTYSSPPQHGSYIINEIVKNSSWLKLWQNELEEIRLRILNLRHKFFNLLTEKFPDKDWSCITMQRGFFTYMGIAEKQVMTLREKYAIYIPLDGRVNLAGLNSQNIDYVVEAITATFKQT